MKKFVYKHVVAFSTILFIVSTPLLWYLLDIPLNAIGMNYQYSLAVKNMTSAVVVIVFMRCILGKCILSFKGEHFFKYLFTFGLVGLIGSLGAFIFNFSGIDMKPTAFAIIGYLAMNLAIAFNEEVVFRGIILNTMRKVWDGQSKVIPKAVFLSSLLFGLKHIINLITYPNQIVITIAQIVFAGMAGIYLAAVYVRSQNIWVVILIHFLEDTAVTIMELFSTQAANSSIADITITQALLMILIQIPYVWVGVLMLKENKVKSKVV